MTDEGRGVRVAGIMAHRFWIDVVIVVKLGAIFDSDGTSLHSGSQWFLQTNVVGTADR